MNNNNLISIIIPVYNRPKLVAECLDSVLAQTNPNWECIVVDDGSTDDTWKVLEKYAEKDKRIRIFKRDRAPKGAPTCRNIGADKAKGDYLLFLDSDDIIGKYCINTRLSYINKYTNLDFIVFPEVTFKEIPSKYYFAKNLFSKEKDDLNRFLQHDHPWLTSGPIWWKNNFLRNYLYLEGISAAQDWELHVRVLMKQPKYLKITEKIEPDLFERSNPNFKRISNNRKIAYKLYQSKIKIALNLISQAEFKKEILTRPLRKRLFISYFYKYCIALVNENKSTYALNFWKEFSTFGIINRPLYLFWHLHLFALTKNIKFLRKGIEFIAFRLLKNNNFLNNK